MKVNKWLLYFSDNYIQFITDADKEDKSYIAGFNGEIKYASIQDTGDGIIYQWYRFGNKRVLKLNYGEMGDIVVLINHINKRNNILCKYQEFALPTLEQQEESEDE